MSGRVAGRYELLGKLGRGSVSDVYRARDVEIGRDVAVKFLRETLQDSDVVRKRFIQEAQAVARLSHPNVVKVHDAGEAGGRMFIVMELVEGTGLDSLIREHPFNADTAAELMRRVALGVHAAHEAGVVHRDLKPANILVGAAGEAKVVDFGLAHLADSDGSLTKPGTILGTPRYMAPEQVRSGGAPVTRAVDIYSLGAILFEMLAGQPVHPGESTFDVISAVLSDDATLLRRVVPDAPAALEAIVARALDRQPANRYASALALADDLGRFLAGESVKAPAAASLRRRAAKHGPALAVGATLLLIVGVAVLLLRNAAADRNRHASEADERARHREDARRAAQAGDRLVEEIAATMREPDYRLEDLRRLAERAQTAYETAKDDPVALLGAGRAWALAGDAKRAAAFYDRTIAAAPDFALAYVARARLRLPRYEELRHLPGGASRPEDDEARRLRAVIESDVRKAETLSKETPERLFADAILAFSSSEYEKAQELLGRYLSVAPWDGEAHYWRGHALLHLERPADAEKELTLALRSNTRDLAAYLGRGSALRRLGRTADAVADYSAAIAIEPGSAAAYIGRGNVRSDLGERLAITDLSEGIKLDPANAHAWFDRGMAHERLGDYPDAMADFTTSESLDGHPRETIFRRGACKRKQGDNDGALADFASAIERQPQLAEALLARGVILLERQKSADAMTDFNRAIAAKPDLAAPYYHRARIRRMLGELRPALDDSIRYVGLDPAACNGWQLRAELHRDLREFAEALAAAKEAMRVHPEDVAHLVNVAAARKDAGDVAGALADYEEALRRNPRQLAARYNRGTLRIDRRELDGAIEDLTVAVDMAPESVEARANRGVAYKLRGDKAAAIADLEKALTLAPADWRYRDLMQKHLDELRKGD